MNFKKRVNGSWVDIPYYIRKTAADIFTTLPITIYADGTAITAYTIKGNEEHTGTPTPSNPVEVNGVGVRTAQLYNSADTIWVLGILDDNGQNTGATTSHYTGNFTEVNANTSYVIGGTLGAGSNQYRIYFYDTEKRWISRTPPKAITENSFTTPVNCKYIQIQVVIAVVSTTDWMLNEGSTALPYEPWGVKIPISSAGVTTNIYLGSTQATRQIKQLVLDGTENWNEGVSAFGYRFITPITNAMQSDTTIGVRSMCTHQELTSTGNTYNALGVYTITGSSELIMTLDGNTRLASWKSWLAAQYAAGSPVTVWYVLATPQTAAVNEPLMKIDNYADTLSNAASIPTTEGANSITVDTTVQPSEFTATWTGWHDSSVKEYVGGHTVNLFDDTNVINVNGLGNRYGVILPDGTYSIYNGTDNTMYYGVNNWIGRFSACEPHSTATITLTNTPGTVGGVFMPLDSSSQGGCTVVEGSTPPDHYIPYYTWVDD